MIAMIARNKEKTIKIIQDGWAENPREWGNLGTMVCWHGKYDLGDNHKFEDSIDFFKSLLNDVLDKNLKENIIMLLKKGELKNLKLEYNPSSRDWVLKSYSDCVGKWFIEDTFAAPISHESDWLFSSIVELLEPTDIMNLIKGYYTILPLYLYDHSGLSMNTSGFSCPWDSGQVGWIYCNNEKALRQ